MKHRGVNILAGVLGVVWFWTLSSAAQWVTQRIPLHAGWNAVCFEVEPFDKRCDAVFAGVPVESVWRWNKRFTPEEFTVDPNTLLPEDPHWLVWFPSNSPTAFLSRLFGVDAGCSYLVKLPDDAPAVTLSVKGTPKVTRPEWSAHALALVGLPVDPDASPTFADYFHYTPEVDAAAGFKNELYAVGSDGKPRRIVAATREPIRRGTAYWVKCAKAPRTTGVLDLRPGTALAFGRWLLEQDLTLYNASSSDPLEVRIREVSSEPAPLGAPENKGDVPLSYYEFDEQENVWIWKPLAMGQTLALTLAPGEKRTVRFRIRREDMPLFGVDEGSCQSILEVRSISPALLYRVPVSALARPLLGAPGAPGASAGDVAEAASKGLWVGRAVLDRVNCPAYSGTNTLPAPPLSMRLIVHVDAQGRARLLQEVFMAAVLLDADTGEREFRLFSDRKHIPSDAEKVSRIASAAFPIMPPVEMSGSLADRLEGEVTVNCNDPSNPFLHRYNPLHDNCDWDFKPYDHPVETLTVSRHITMDFSSVTTNHTVDPILGDDVVEGTYRERVEGLRKQALFVEGRFFLKRISVLDRLY